jgi:SAM-dependent methyltransferase
MFTSESSPRSIEVDLLSSRFTRDSSWSRKTLNAKQQTHYELLLKLASSNQVRFEHSPCPCAVESGDIVIAQRDRYGLPIDSVLCKECGCVRIDPYFDASSLAVFYTEIYQELYGRSQKPEEYFQRQRTYGRKILKNIFGDEPAGNRRVLEVGCGGGGGLSVFQEAGFQVQGCDYSSELISFGTQKGVANLVVGPVEAVENGEKGFDLIYMHHVMEHVGDPLATLQSIRKLMKPNGKILVIVPDLSRIDSHKFCPSDTMEFLHIAHKYNFSRECFSSLASQASSVASEIVPTGERTVWSDAPELWVLFTDASSKTKSSRPNSRMVGRHLLSYLKATEQDFMSKQTAIHQTVQVDHDCLSARAMIQPSKGRLTKIVRELKRPLRKLGILK